MRAAALCARVRLKPGLALRLLSKRLFYVRAMTKLSCLQKNNFGHTKVEALDEASTLSVSSKVSSAAASTTENEGGF